MPGGLQLARAGRRPDCACGLRCGSWSDRRRDRWSGTRRPRVRPRARATRCPSSPGRVRAAHAGQVGGQVGVAGRQGPGGALAVHAQQPRADRRRREARAWPGCATRHRRRSRRSVPTAVAKRPRGPPRPTAGGWLARSWRRRPWPPGRPRPPASAPARRPADGPAPGCRSGAWRCSMRRTWSVQTWWPRPREPGVDHHAHLALGQTERRCGPAASSDLVDRPAPPGSGCPSRGCPPGAGPAPAPGR